MSACRDRSSGDEMEDDPDKLLAMLQGLRAMKDPDPETCWPRSRRCVC